MATNVHTIGDVDNVDNFLFIPSHPGLFTFAFLILKCGSEDDSREIKMSDLLL